MIGQACLGWLAGGRGAVAIAGRGGWRTERWRQSIRPPPPLGKGVRRKPVPPEAKLLLGGSCVHDFVAAKIALRGLEVLAEAQDNFIRLSRNVI